MVEKTRKYIFFDIDGTLTSHTRRNYISDSTFLALKKLKEQGHFISLATGRAVHLTKEISELTGVDSLICEGGNGIIVNGELQSYEPIDLELSKSILLQCDNVGLKWGISNRDDASIVTKESGFIKVIENVSFVKDLVVDASYDYNKETAIRRIIIENKPELFEKIKDIYKIGLMVYGESPFALIEPDDKYKGIKKLILQLGASERDVIVFGDGLNDYKMFKQATFSVAMGNASDELKAIAHYVTDDADSDGIYNACLKLKLIK